MSTLSRRHRPSVTESRPFEGLSRIHLHAAGVDIGAREIMVCVPGPDDTQLVRAFGTYTANLYALADWLSEHCVQTVAMESTGVYWIPLFETLEARGFKCSLISATSTSVFPVASRMCWTASGSRPCTVTACWRIRFDPKPT